MNIYTRPNRKFHFILVTSRRKSIDTIWEQSTKYICQVYNDNIITPARWNLSRYVVRSNRFSVWATAYPSNRSEFIFVDHCTWRGPRREAKLGAKKRFICDRPHAAGCRAAGWSGREAGCLWSAIWQVGPDRAARQEDRARRKSARPSLPATRIWNLFQRFPQNYGFFGNYMLRSIDLRKVDREVCEKMTRHGTPWKSSTMSNL